VLEPLDFLRRLAALIPAPYAHMVRYHGCFANHARARALLPAPPPSPAAPDQAQTAPAAVPGEDGNSAVSIDQPEDTAHVRRTPLPWAQLLRRVFFIDALKCPRCSSAMVILAFLSDPPVVAKILRHLRLPTAPPPLAPARGGGGSGAWAGRASLPLSPDDPGAEVPEHAEVCDVPTEGLPLRASARAEIRPPP